MLVCFILKKEFGTRKLSQVSGAWKVYKTFSNVVEVEVTNRYSKSLLCRYSQADETFQPFFMALAIDKKDSLANKASQKYRLIF